MEAEYFESRGVIEIVDGTIRFQFRSPRNEEFWWFGREAVALLLSNFMQKIALNQGFCLNLSPEILKMVMDSGAIPEDIVIISETDEYYQYDFSIRVAIQKNKVEDFLADLGMDADADGFRADWNQTRPDPPVIEEEAN